MRPSCVRNSTQRWFVVTERRFETTYRLHLQGASSLLGLNPVRICFKISFLVGKIVCCLRWNLHRLGGTLSSLSLLICLSLPVLILPGQCVSAVRNCVSLCEAVETVGSGVQLDKQWLDFSDAEPSNPDTVIPRLTKIIRSGITFISRNVILYKLYKYIIHFILLNWKYVHNVFTILLPNFQSLFKVSSWNGLTVHVGCFMLARASTKTFVSRVRKTAKKSSLAEKFVSRVTR